MANPQEPGGEKGRSGAGASRYLGKREHKQVPGLGGGLGVYPLHQSSWPPGWGCGAQPFPSFSLHSEAVMEIQGDQLLSLKVEPENPAGASLVQCAGMLHFHVENKSLCV